MPHGVNNLASLTISFLIWRRRDLRVLQRLVIRHVKKSALGLVPGMYSVIIVIDINIIFVASCWAIPEGFMAEWGLDYMATEITYDSPQSSGGGSRVRWSGAWMFWNQTDQVLSLGCASFFMVT